MFFIGRSNIILRDHHGILVLLQLLYRLLFRIYRQEIRKQQNVDNTFGGLYINSSQIDATNVKQIKNIRRGRYTTIYIACNANIYDSLEKEGRQIPEGQSNS